MICSIVRAGAAENSMGTFRIRWWGLLSSGKVWVLALNWFSLNWCVWVLLTELPKYMHGTYICP